MGTVCARHPKENQESFEDNDAFKIIELNQLRAVKFQFTCQKLVALSSDLLVLFMNHSIDIKRNDHFKNSQSQAKKIEEYAKAYIDNNQLKEQYQSQQLEFITFDVQIPTFNYKTVSILFCDIWKQETSNDTSFRRVLRNYFESLKNYSFKSVIITEFEPILGVHLQRGVKRLLRQIVKMPNKPELIEFACLNSESKQVFMEGANEKKEDLLLSFTSSHLMSNAETDYF